MVPQAIINIAEICAQHQVQHVVLSPGSRNAPLTLAFSRHPEMNIKVIGDERAAGFIALGMAQYLNKPVVLLSTSGTSVLNYGPAVAEAFYRNIPLLIITADRPPEWIDQKDGQTIRQQGVFQNHIRDSVNLPAATDHPDVNWHIEREVNQAIITTMVPHSGPVHINVPLREPLYPQDNDRWEYKLQYPVKVSHPAGHHLADSKWEELIGKLQSSERPLILGGQWPRDPRLWDLLEGISLKCNIPLLGDALSNLHSVKGSINHLEMILGQDDRLMKQLQPDLLISYGGPVISKNVKQFLRKYPAGDHWHIQHLPKPSDTFKSLREMIPMAPTEFFQELTNRIKGLSPHKWYQQWHQEEARAGDFIDSFNKNQVLNEMQAVSRVLEALPACHLHAANSMSVRWVDLFGIKPDIKEFSANRGTSGIDGCNSTAVGCALVDSELQVLLTGDMAFLYDRNAFWHNYSLDNLRIVVLNNQGGGIFRLIDGPPQQPECEQYFVTEQRSTAEHTAREFGFDYLLCHTGEELQRGLEKLFSAEPKAGILEIMLPDNMQGIYKELKKSLRNNYE